MSATWTKNEITAAKRRCAMLIQKSDMSLAPRGTDFSDLGFVYISGVTAPDFTYATGSMTNQRVRIDFDDTAWAVEATDTGADTIQITGHPFETGDGPIQSDLGFGNLTVLTDYWIRVIDADNIALYETLRDAYDDTNRLDLDFDATGATLIDTANTKRGLDGHFVYEATQAETNHNGAETIVIVHDETDYNRNNLAGGYTTVSMRSDSEDVGATELENGLTRDDAWRIILRTLAAKFSKSGNDYVYRDMADSKDSHTGTVTPAGRTNADIEDPD